jgi:acylpyruvate hydrolase
MEPAEGDPVQVISAGGWQALGDRATRQVSRGSVRYLAPVARSGKIFGVGLNYRDHAIEHGMEPPPVPALFAKFATSLLAPGDAIPLHPVTEQTDYEAELGVVIAQRAWRLGVEDALSCVAGYTICNDVTARDLQASDVQWVRGKGLDGYAPIGPVVVSADEFGQPEGHAITGWVNGELRQESNTDQLIFGVAELIAHITEAMTLEPGDVIATGTPSGVGHHMSPPRYLSSGDKVTVAVEGIGELTNPVG